MNEKEMKKDKYYVKEALWEYLNETNMWESYWSVLSDKDGKVCVYSEKEKKEEEEYMLKRANEIIGFLSYLIDKYDEFDGKKDVMREKIEDEDLTEAERLGIEIYQLENGDLSNIRELYKEYRDANLGKIESLECRSEYYRRYHDYPVEFRFRELNFKE